MRKKILGGFVVVAIAAMATFNINFSIKGGNELSVAINLANVEALASGEGTNACEYYCQDFPGTGCRLSWSEGGVPHSYTCWHMEPKT